MIPWECLDRTQVPETGEELVLFKRNNEYSIRARTFLDFKPNSL